MLPGHAEDTTPSFVIDPGDRGWSCVGCQRGGDLVAVARLVRGLARCGDVVAVLTGAAGIAPPAELGGARHPLRDARMASMPPTTVTVAGQTLTLQQSGGKRGADCT